MTGVMMAVLNSVQPATSAIPTPTLYLDANDYTGSGTTWPAEYGVNDATLVNTPTYAAPSPTYFSFAPAAGEKATVPDLGDLNTWTVEAWFRVTTSLTGQVTSVVTNQFDGSNLNFSIGTNRAPTSYNICVGFFNGAWRTTTGFAPTLNTWYHVVGTYNGSTIRQYVDAVQDTTLSYSGTPVSGGEIRIASRWDSQVVPTDFFPGDIGLVRIWNSALTAQQVDELYNENVDRFSNSVVTSNLVGYWDPGLVASYPGTGTTINDVSGNGLNGTMSNITWTDPYFTYNGTNSQVSIADNALLEPGAGSWTMEVWVRQTVSGNDVVLGKFDPGGTSADVSYSIRTTGTSYYAQIGSGSGSGSTLFVNSTTFVGTLNTWYQLVYVFTNGGTKTLETFVNGSSIGSVSHNLASILNTSSNLYLGGYNNGEYTQWFDGRIGIVRLYNAALTSGQVLQNYNANKGLYGL